MAGARRLPSEVRKKTIVNDNNLIVRKTKTKSIRNGKYLIVTKTKTNSARKLKDSFSRVAGTIKINNSSKTSNAEAKQATQKQAQQQVQK